MIILIFAICFGAYNHLYLISKNKHESFWSTIYATLIVILLTFQPSWQVLIGSLRTGGSITASTTYVEFTYVQTLLMGVISGIFFYFLLKFSRGYVGDWAILFFYGLVFVLLQFVLIGVFETF